MRMAFGWRPEIIQPDSRLSWPRSGLRAGGVLPEVVSLVRDLDMGGAILDQGPTSACVAHACAGAVRLRTAIQARALSLASVPLPSRRWIYRLARETHHEGHEDGGTFISAGLYVMRTLGWPDERRFPWVPALVNAGVPVDARHHAHDQRDAVAEYAITAWGDDRRQQVREALAAGHPIIFGAHVDRAFLECAGWDRQEISGEPVGGHAMILVGYDGDGCHVLNSWGPDWGMGGLGLLSWTAVGSRIRDLRVVTLTKEPTT
jgi:hypothetical protein